MTGPSFPMARTCPFDPPPELARLQAEEPVHRVALWDGSTPWLVTRYDDVRTVLTDARFSADVRTPGYPPTSPAMLARRRSAPAFISMDDPEHARYRRMLASEFTVRRVDALRPMVEETVAELIDVLVAGPRPGDLVSGFALPLPSLVICRMLGVPYADHGWFQEHSRTIVDTRTAAEDGARATAELHSYLVDLVGERERTGADDLLGRLAGLVRDGALRRDEAASMGMLLLVAGHETTANMISMGTLTLLRDPHQAALVRDGDEAVVRTAVEELLRLQTVVHLGRRRAALADVDLGTVTIHAGEGVVAAADAANRDPDVFDDPDTLDVHRAPNHHVTFGFGVHQCLGQQLARLELRIAYPALLRRLPGLRLAVELDEIPFRDEMLVFGAHALPVTW